MSIIIQPLLTFTRNFVTFPILRKVQNSTKIDNMILQENIKRDDYLRISFFEEISSTKHPSLTQCPVHAYTKDTN